MGTKPKFWVRHPVLGQSLFKAARPGTGEDWAEKVGAEIANLLGLPHATYELAVAERARGTISPSFVGDGATLVHGNELLVRFNPTYVEFNPLDLRAGYTVDQVLEALQAASVQVDPRLQLPPSVDSAPALLTGYLLLDALIGNTDRHHENWAAIQPAEDVSPFLSPTFDHASSLGRNESERRMGLRLDTRDRMATVEAYASKALSPFFDIGGRRLSPEEAFQVAARFHTPAAGHWLSQLEAITPSDFADILARIPDDRMTSTARTFVERFLRHNRGRLVRVVAELL